MKAIVLTNPAAGAKADGSEELRHALHSAGIAPDIRQVPGDKITNAARDAASSGVDAVIAAGGDGTVSAVATALAGTAMPLGIIPSGTLNHFAKDLGLPTTLAEAVRVIAARNVAHADVGDVNGRIFIN